MTQCRHSSDHPGSSQKIAAAPAVARRLPTRGIAHARNKCPPPVALTLRRGCVHYDQAAGLWLLRGRQWKGVVDQAGSKLPQGQERPDPWVVVEPVAHAVAVLERLHDDPLLFPTTLLVGHRAGITRERRGKARTTPLITDDITRLVAWVNDYCTAHRRDDRIPPDPSRRALAPSRLRRTLAWFIVRRPRGLVAGAIQYGHVQVQITLGYSGTYASGFPDEHAFETWLLRLEQFAHAQQRLADGEHVSGPAARAYRDRTLQANQQFAGRVLDSTRQARDLLANPALQIYPAKGMTCVFDPAKAKCRLKPASDDARRTPDLTDCQPGCQNIARTDHDIDQLRSRAVQLAELAADPLSPQSRRQREHHELQRLRTIIDEHDHTRPQPPPRRPAGERMTSADLDSQRAAIQAAADRLLAGTPLRSTGELTVVQLAAEAGVKRWLLTHKHRDLAEQFQARAKAIGGDPPSVQKLKARVRELEDALVQLRIEQTERQALLDYYAHIINELSIDYEQVKAERDSLLGNVRPLAGRRPRV